MINIICYYIKRLIHKVNKKNELKNTQMHKKSKLTYDIQIVNSRVGRYSYIGEHSTVIGTSIGDFCSIGDRCVIGGPAHNLSAVSTSPVFAKGRNIFNINFSQISFEEYKTVTIENDVWLGSCCLIKSGVKIATGAVVGMGSIVTHDVEPYTIVAGNPAKVIGKRFDDNTIDALLKSKWWEMSDDFLLRYGSCFENPTKFLTALREENKEK